MNIRSLLLGALSGIALGASMAMPRLGQQYTPTFAERAAPEYDGLGRKKPRPIVGPNHNAKRRTAAWREYAAKVVSTHRVLPDGTWQDDPRDPKYLHSHARAMGGLRKALGTRSLR